MSYDAAFGSTSDGRKGVNFGGGSGALLFRAVDFGAKGVSQILAKMSGDNMYAFRHVQIRIDDQLNGQLLGTLAAASSGNINKFTAATATLSSITGVHDLYLILPGGEGLGMISKIKIS